MNEALTSIFSSIHRCYERHLGSQSYVIGVDCCRKTTFSQRLAEHFASHGIASRILDIDEFNDASMEAQFYDTFGSGAWSDQSLEKYYGSISNFDDANRAVREANKENRLVILEGIFSYKPQLVAVFDLKIYLDVELSIAKQRFAKRRANGEDARPFAILEQLWFPSHCK